MKPSEMEKIRLNPSSTKSVLLLALQVAKSQDWSLKQSRLKQLFLRYAPDMVIFRERLFILGNGLRRWTVFGLTILSGPVMVGIVLVGAVISVATGLICRIILTLSGSISRPIMTLRTQKTSNPSHRKAPCHLNSLPRGERYSGIPRFSATSMTYKKAPTSQCSLDI